MWHPDKNQIGKGCQIKTTNAKWDFCKMLSDGGKRKYWIILHLFLNCLNSLTGQSGAHSHKKAMFAFCVGVNNNSI